MRVEIILIEDSVSIGLMAKRKIENGLSRDSRYTIAGIQWLKTKAEAERFLEARVPCADCCDVFLLDQCLESESLAGNALKSKIDEKYAEAGLPPLIFAASDNPFFSEECKIIDIFQGSGKIWNEGTLRYLKEQIESRLLKIKEFPIAEPVSITSATPQLLLAVTSPLSEDVSATAADSERSNPQAGTGKSKTSDPTSECYAVGPSRRRRGIRDFFCCFWRKPPRIAAADVAPTTSTLNGAGAVDSAPTTPVSVEIGAPPVITANPSRFAKIS